MNGLFVTLEGLDGCGKTTQWHLLKQFLENNNIPNVCIREPGSTPLGENLRNIIKNPNEEITPITEAYLYATCRAQLVEHVILPALTSGKVIVCDRFLDSSLVYQGVARGLGINIIKEINKNAVADIVPNVTFFIDTPIEITKKRILHKDKDRLELEGDNFINAVYKGYKQLTKENSRIITLDGTKSIEFIHRSIISKMREIL